MTGNQVGRPRRDWWAWTQLATVVSALGALIAVAVSYCGANQQAELTRQGQFTDRYSKAVEQLGTPGVSNATVRLGGIYALQRLARDSKEDRGTIVEVLAAFVRDPAGRPKNTPTPKAVPPRPPTDVAAALKVLDRLGGLRGVDLSGANLTGANLRGANLRGANLTDADLTRADLFGANLQKVNLFGADLTGAAFLGAHLTGAILFGADLSGATLFQADLTGATVSYANLKGAGLFSADLTGTDLTGTNLTGTNLRRANLREADLTGADLRRADLREADLTDADLTGADLRGVKGFPSPAPTRVRPS